jgi:mRNA interferase MazF
MPDGLPEALGYRQLSEWAKPLCAPRPYGRRCARPRRDAGLVPRSSRRCEGSQLTRAIERRCGSSANRWRNSLPSPSTEVVRGEIFRLPAPHATRGREQRGARYAVVVQADEFLALSTVLISPTSTSARAASFRPAITLGGSRTCILVEQTTVVDPQRLGRSAGRLDADELQSVDEAIALIFGI